MGRISYKTGKRSGAEAVALIRLSNDFSKAPLDGVDKSPIRPIDHLTLQAISSSARNAQTQLWKNNTRSLLSAGFESTTSDLHFFSYTTIDE